MQLRCAIVVAEEICFTIVEQITSFAVTGTLLPLPGAFSSRTLLENEQKGGLCVHHVAQPE